MRITAEAKTETRQRILQAATRLFKSDGWHETTTRGITGTLFNYFPTKEALAAELIGSALRRARESFSNEGDVNESLEADLFSLIWPGFLSLREFRTFLAPAAETIFSPLARSSPESPGDVIRVDHLEHVEEIIRLHGFPGPRSTVTMQLYWTLYLGVFAFWAADDSPGQEDTLALLDQALKLFVTSLSTTSVSTKEEN